MEHFRLLDTYKAYKLRDRKFTTWLRETAEKLGTRSKSEEGVRVHEIPSLVKSIISRGQLIPETLRQVLRDVISMRKEVKAFYKPQGQVDVDERHAHYIAVLEAALKAFESASSSSNSSGGAQSEIAGSGPSESSAKKALNNLFDILRVPDEQNEISEAGLSGGESTDEKESDKENHVEKAKKVKGKIRFGKRKGKARNAKKSETTIVVRKPVTDIEIYDAMLQTSNDFDDEEDDLYFMIYFFFKDFQALREYIQERWCDYQDGLLSLSAVSLITNTAYELLQKGEEDLISQIPRHTGLREYREMANMLFLDVGLLHVDYDAEADGEEGQRESIYEEADFLCLPRYWDLFEFLNHIPPKKIVTSTPFQGILSSYIKFVSDFDVPLRPAIKTTSKEIDCWILNDFPEPRRTDFHIQHGELEEGQEAEAFYYLRRNPILCGLMIFRFSLTMNELGLSNSNQWGATIAATHLYNAIRHEQESFPQWLDMEALLFIHGTSRIFWRDHLPSNPDQYAKPYERATGVNEMISQRGSGKNVIIPRRLYERGIAPVSIVSTQFHNRFCFAHSNPVKTLPDVERLLNATAEDEIEQSLSGLRLLEGSSSTKSQLSRLEQDSNKELTNQFQGTHALMPTQLLSALATRVSQENYALNFDYFSFHVRCMHILQSVYKEFKVEIDAEHGELDWGKGELPVVPAWIFGALERAYGSASSEREEIAQRLGTAMQGIVNEEGGREINALKNFWGDEKQGLLERGLETPSL
ncbi:hypothetical protein LSUE1_G008498 [Lachnellula suecica]|uniref:DUF6604 domain-containing protein n=1 Tax=Lachnellula suecica TaxID=602035 RepID=A0A8T9C0Z9_9HELO|nr:hypothetical protein LSUE1_G008498 [Lachnellula suecica]